MSVNNNNNNNTNNNPPRRCNIYYEELIKDQKVSDQCLICKELVAYHERDPHYDNKSIQPNSQSLTNTNNSSASMSVPTSILNNLPKWKVDYKHAKPFLQRFEQVLTAANVDETNWPRLLLHSVENVSEAQWIKINIVDFKPTLKWSEAKDVFTKHFGNYSYHMKVVSEYESCKQLKHESVQKYADRFTQLCDDLCYDYTDKLVIQHFIMGLLPNVQADYRKHIHLAKLANNNSNINLGSLRDVIELTLELSLLDLNHQPHSSTTSDTSDSKNSSPAKKKLYCKFHPDSTSHTTAQCRSHNSYNNNNNNATAANDNSGGGKDKPKYNNDNKSGAKKPVVCKLCGGPHYPNDPSCPKKTIFTRAEQAKASSSTATTASTQQSTTTTTATNNLATRSVSFQDAVDEIKNNINAVHQTLPASVVIPEKLDIMIFLNDQLFKALVDSGADLTLIDEALCKELKLKVTATNGIIHLAHANVSVPRIGHTELDVTFLFPCTERKAIHGTRRFEVLPIHDKKNDHKDYHFIIGKDLLPVLFPDGCLPLAYISKSPIVNGAPSISITQLDTTNNEDANEMNPVPAKVDPNEIPQRIAVYTPQDLEFEYSIKRTSLLADLQQSLTINQSITGFCNLPESVVSLDVNPELKSKLYRKQYPIAQQLYEPTNAVIQRWFEAGKITYAPPNCEYNNPLTVAPKKDEQGKYTGIRVCLDVRALNKALIIGDKFPIPHIRDVLESFAGNSVFGEFDLSEAYLQFTLHPDSQPLTAFTWNRRQYMFVGCPYGIKLLTCYFQRVMTRVFHDLPFVVPYVDNIPFGSADWAQHKEHALLIINRLNQVNLRLKPHYNVGHAQMRCLGHVLSIKGVAPDPDKLQAIKDWPLPSTGADLQSFLGLGTFLRQHIRHYAELTGPLEAIKYQKNIEWNDMLVECFKAVQQAFAAAPILSFPDFDRPFHIATDASKTGVGGVLFQPANADEHITPNNIVAICSKKLKGSQENWPAYKKELYGVVYSLRKFHSYVWGRNDLVVHTDHKPLIHMFTSAQLSPALQQWLDVILDYHFDIRHRDGILNVIPDALSRMFCTQYASAEAWGVGKAPFPESTPIQINLIDLEVENEHSQGGRNESNDSIDNKTQVDLQVELAKRGKRSPDSEEEKLKLIQETHLFGHFGQDAVFKSLYNKGYWWPSIRNQIDSELKNCDACNRFVVVKQGFHPAQFITANGPCEHIQIDTSVHLPESPEGYKALLVCIDVFTGFIMLKPLRDTTAETVARKIWKIFCIIGFPKIIQSDNGPEFANDVIRALVKVAGIEHRLISPYNPRADGKVERSIQSIMMIIKKLLHGTNKHWPLFVPFAQITFNNKISSLTATSPFALMFGRELNELKDYSAAQPNLIPLDDWKQHQEKIISLIYPAVSERIRSGKDKLVQTLNKNRRLLLPQSFPAGSTVMIIDPDRQNKFEPKYIGPYTIARRARNGAYVLKDATGDLLDRHVPADQMKLISKQTRRIDKDKPIYEINKIVSHRGNPGSYEYYVDWKGYTENDRTWEPESSFLDQSSIQKYWNTLNSNSNSNAD
jgi:RNase H-like domain found in reverse transcriptase/Integrase core domain/Chromo (CHRromatin Organisation MOdifier) domain/Integrase zinc binding domain/Reverse transcriptase (RNA-dependent DNA polymerase)/Retrotransposon gag protein